LAGAKAKRDLLAVAVAATDELDDLLQKCSHWKTIRVAAWINRFIRNARTEKIKRLGGLLTAEEMKQAEFFWVKRVQTRATADGRYQEDVLQLNLQPNRDGVLECRGRIQGHYPIFLPDGQRYTEKLVAQAHLATLHGGVGSTMAKVRVLLGATVEKIDHEDCEVLPRMSAVKGTGLYLSTTRESSKGSDGGPNTLSSHWS